MRGNNLGTTLAARYPQPGAFDPTVPFYRSLAPIPGGSYGPSANGQSQAIPIPRPNPLAAQASQPVGQPMNLNPAAQMDFAGLKGPQWNNQQFKNFWDRANGSY